MAAIIQNIIYSNIQNGRHCNNCTLILIQETKPGDWATCDVCMKSKVLHVMQNE